MIRSSSENDQVTPAMIEAGILEVWPDPKPPAFIRGLVERIYLSMERMRLFEIGVSARRQ